MKQEQEHSPEQHPSWSRYWEIRERIEETKPDTPLAPNLLDELLSEGTKYYKAAAQKSDEFHEEFGKEYLLHLRAAQGSYYEEKPQFCENLAKFHTEQALFHARVGNQELARDYRRSASNWHRMTAACLLMPEARPQPPTSPSPTP